ncbi:5'-methylthioadenosine/S-adenosylhomocysteine nucleosidase [Salinicola rhizosphaerae]|uniref:5'-methylthioadenosine/S-adenosylhomocysteine nucleosidase n=1 Tax=Salinicola rhizosphaerae TaxID=1443141 RepID=A0ABQ3DQA0_9GAMM|nr:5'-methylthioadenosine/S-adenosylhomocysteine nucleosidase [Salinicola rhizosphaerae]GHB10435.1 5'-methylthioadenosine/S-adenosylhomocysteine nucleosidase [Salinicola rhizosphaerae]
MQTIGIIGAMEQEVALLASQLDNARVEHHPGGTFHCGERHGINIVLLQSGIGKVNAAVGTTQLLTHYAPALIINTGSAGGFGAELDVGDVVISNEVRHHDVDVTAFGYDMGQVPGMPVAFAAAPDLIETARDCIEALGELRVHEGLICTGDSFMADPGRVDATRAHFPQMLAVEMEAAAIAQTCHLFGCPFVVIRALSDIAGKESHLSFDAFLEQAATHSAKMVDAIVARLAAR